MARYAICVLATLHLPAFALVWIAVLSVCVITGPTTAGLSCILWVIAGIFLSIVLIWSFWLAVNACLERQR